MQYCVFVELAMVFKLCHSYALAVRIIMILSHKGQRSRVRLCFKLNSLDFANPP